MNVGCIQISLKEILIFGGYNQVGELQKEGKILMIENEEKGSYLFL